MWFALICAIVIALLIYKLVFSVDTKNYWAQYGIRQIDGSSVASQKDIYAGVKDYTDRDTYAYQLLGDEKFCGMAEMGRNIILIKDLELAKKIFIKDFDYFMDR